MRLCRLVPAALAALALLSAGCLDFEKQSFVVTFNADKDEGHALLLYEGLQSHAKDDKELKRDLDMLEAFFVTGKMFYLGHPILGVSLESEKPDPKAKPDPRKERYEKLVKDHVSVGGQAFFLNKEGALCGTQVVKVGKVSKFIAGLNELISEEAVESAQTLLKDQTKRGKIDLETLQLREKAGLDKLQWIRHEPGRISVTVVGSPKYLADLKREVINDTVMTDLRRLGKPNPQDRNPMDIPAELKKRMKEFERGAEFLAEVPLGLELRKGRMTVSLGLGDGEPIRAFSPYVPEKKAKTEPLVEHAKTLKVPMLKDATAESVVADFLKKYPPKK